MEGQPRRDLLEVVGPLYRSLRRIEEQCARAFGLSMWQYAILAVAAAQEGLSQAVIADRIGYNKNRIVADLDVLTSQDLAERRPGTDRRSYAIYATDAGSALVAKVRECIWQREDELLSNLSLAKRELLMELLSTVASADHRSFASEEANAGVLC